MIKKQILIIEDDDPIQRIIKLVMNGAGFDVLQAHNAASAKLLLMTESPDLLILDLGLPDTDGSNLLSAIRRSNSVPVLVLTARDQTEDKLALFQIGIDDYVTKPFEPLELLARVKSILSRTYTTTGIGKGILQSGDLMVDLDRQITKKGEEQIHLSQKEYGLLSLLIQHEQSVLTYDVLIKNVWGQYFISGHNDTLRVTMAHLRRKLGTYNNNQYISTDVGVGYRWVVEVKDNVNYPRS